MNGTEPSLPKLVKAYRALRDKRSDLKNAFDKEEALLRNKQDTIQQALLDHCSANGVTSVKTEEGTFFRKKKVSYWCNDWDKVHTFIKEHKIPEMLQKRLSQKNVEEFLGSEENKDIVIEGLKTDAVYTITVQKPRG